jgi:non-heme chloroperoxidase
MTSGGESERLFEAYSIPSPTRPLPLFQTAFGNLNRRSPTGMDTQNPDRVALLLISCRKEHMVPDVATRANYKLYGESTPVTDLKQFADRGHSLTIDGRWRQVADADFALGWLTRRGISATAPSESRLR